MIAMVNLTLHSGVYSKPNTSTDLAATYGFAGTADYYVTSGTGTWSASSPFTSATLTIPAGAYAGEVSVVTRADELTEQNLIVCRLAQSTAYAPGVSTNVHVLIFDGPEWTLLEVDLDNLGPTGSSAAYAVNDVNGATQPYVAGYGAYYAYGNYNWLGGWWPLPGVTFAHGSENLAYRGVSTSPVLFVGTSGSNARVKPLSGSAFNLPHLDSSPSQAFGIDGDAAVIVGSSRNSVPVVRPVVWEDQGGGTWQEYDLAVDLPSSSWAGAALAVSRTSWHVAGQQYVSYTGGSSGSYAFRSQAYYAPLAFDQLDGIGDILYAPYMGGVENQTAVAHAVNDSGATVGSYTLDFGEKRSVYWSAETVGSDALPVDLKFWKAKQGEGIDSQSEAKGINNQGWIVGWSGTSGTPARAVLRKWASTEPEDWLDLNDKHFVHGTSGWVLKEASAINNTGHIVGQGTLNGGTRGFVLIPRTPGN